MKTALAILGYVLLTCCGWTAAQDLPPDILADQYLLEAARAMEKGDTQTALRAFGKIEVLDTVPPLEFLYFYGKLLIENSTAYNDMLKAQLLLKQYVLNIEKNSEHYESTLELLSTAGSRLEIIDERQRAEAETKRHAEAERKQKVARLKELLPQLLSQLEKQMVRVEGGSFTMGCQTGRDDKQDRCWDNAKPAHRVQVESFEIGKYEVTQGLWIALMGEGNPVSRLSRGCVKCPVDSVSWDDVQTFLVRLNASTGKRYRLPTEAEWEYAARGGRQSRGYLYAGSNDVESVGWVLYNRGHRTHPHPVGRKRANELGLHDMSGNVQEWVQDCWNGNYRGAPNDGRAWERGDCSRRVLRGGDYSSGGYEARSADRNLLLAGSRGILIYGFRIAHNLTP